MSRTIFFIHGNFVTKRCWDAWVARFEGRGYRCVAVAYPGRDKPVEVLKRSPNEPILRTLTLAQVTEHCAGAIRALDEKPIVIGHSFGGLLTQLMVDRELAAAAVTIDSIPPQGVLPLEWSFIRATWPIVDPLIPASRPYYMTFTDFQYAFGNDLTPAEQRAAYDLDIVPESRRLARGALSRAARVDFARQRAPLLMIAGERDHIAPASLNRRNYERYRRSPSRTEFKQFPGRAHYSVIGGKGWEEVADYALDWAARVTSKTQAGVVA